jgi:hypothetical protein
MTSQSFIVENMSILMKQFMSCLSALCTSMAICTVNNNAVFRVW